MSFLVDVQLECSGRHPVLRVADADRYFALDLDRTPNAVAAHIWLGVKADWYHARAPLSTTTGKRLALRFLASERTALVDELQPWGEPVRERLRLVTAAPLPLDWRGVRVGGWSVEVPGESYRGRLAEVAFFAGALPDGDIDALRAASVANPERTVPRFAPGTLGAEGRELFLADYAQLIDWHNARRLTHRQLRDAASLAHLWVLDKYPLLQRVSDHYGAMLSFPDLRRAQALVGKIDANTSALWWPQTEHVGNWVSLASFTDDLACWLGEHNHEVTWAAFIKFVRNKLGGGHYDPEERTRWQRELADLARQTQVGGVPWLAVMMLTLVRSLILAADGSGLISLARDESA